uniref:Tyrosinase copper-binding domain-containing protein n=1 Tax=Moniliophthora roreri TaxID=221103 RepID=A0A0W0GD91_MONRR
MLNLALLALFVAFCSASPLGRSASPDYNARCSSPTVRQEWRALTVTEKQEYIDAVKCLQTLPSQTAAIKEAKTRFDDFQSAHIVLADEVHLVGQFLVWHRLYVHTYEKALREECGYQGSQPYWDWTLDIEDGLTSFAASPLFDPTYGFGGNGADIPGYNGFFNNVSETPDWEYGGPGGGCIQDGPFASYNLSLGPGTLITNHCISRWFTPVYLKTITEKNVSQLFTFDTFEEFRIELEGGEMGDRYSSPGDPLFYLHHTNLDRIWWKWQTANPSARLYEISGRSSVDPPFHNVTLDFVLPLKGLGPDVPVRDVMDIRNKVLCYDYA